MQNPFRVTGYLCYMLKGEKDKKEIFLKGIFVLIR